VNTFEIEIPNERLKTYKIFTFIMLTLNFLGFGYVFLRTSSTASLLAIAGLVLNTAPWLYYILNKKHFKTPIVETALIASALLWLYFGNVWMGLLLLFFSIIGLFANKKPTILVSEDGIIFPSFPQKKYSWQAIEQIIWKDDILTIDLKNNKLIQVNINKDFAKDFPVKLFNEFCFSRVLQNKN
jgi:hypothetical protein